MSINKHEYSIFQTKQASIRIKVKLVEHPTLTEVLQIDTSHIGGNIKTHLKIPPDEEVLEYIQFLMSKYFKKSNARLDIDQLKISSKNFILWYANKIGQEIFNQQKSKNLVIEYQEFYLFIASIKYLIHMREDMRDIKKNITPSEWISCNGWFNLFVSIVYTYIYQIQKKRLFLPKKRFCSHTFSEDYMIDTVEKNEHLPLKKRKIL